MSQPTKLFFLLTAVLSFACKSASEKRPDISTPPTGFVIDSLPEYPFPYAVGQPDESFRLPVELKEISGITLRKDEKSMLTVQDEDGIIYHINTEGKILNKYPFWKKGDYEDIVIVRDTVYVVKSTGTLYKVVNLGLPKQYVEKYNTVLSKANDVEGLAYDADNNSLLVACKGNPYYKEGEENPLEKRIYEFPLSTHQLDSTPRFDIRVSDIQRFLKSHIHLKNREKFNEYFSESESKIRISPSAIAFHPISGDLYLLSSGKKMIIVLDRSNHILHLERLDKKLHKQPEGIAFSKNGDMYISNEGQESNAIVYKYSYQKR